MELRRYLTLIWKWAWLLVLGMVLGGAGSYLFSKSLTPIYSASTTLMVQPSSGQAGQNYQDVLMAERLATSYTQLITGRSVLESAAQAMQMPATYAQMARLVSADVVRNTQLIRVTAEHEDPTVAARIANQVAAEFIKKNEDTQLSRLQTSREPLEAEIQQAQSAINDKTAALEAQKGQANTPDNQVRVAQLQRELSDLQQNYAQLVSKADDMKLNQARAITIVTVAEPAVPADRPTRPNVLVNTLLGVLVGIFLAAAISLAIEYLDDAVRNPERVQEVLGLPTLGVVGRFVGGKDGKSAEQLPVLAHVRDVRGEGARVSQAAEAYRALRVNLRFSSLEQPLRTLAITSAVPGEGKTTTAANLAAALAQAGTRVILVDADLRRPSIHRVFGVENRHGLTNVLLDMGIASAKLPLQDTSLPELRIMTSGPIPPNPSELLGSSRMQQVLELLQQEADLVIVDAPPLLAVSDPVLLAAAVDGVILVLDSSTTRTGQALHAREALGRAQANVLGVVLNKLSAKASAYYYDTYYHRAYTAPETATVPNGSAHKDDLVETSGR